MQAKVPAIDQVEAALASDILRGAPAIAEELFGSAADRWKVYNLVKHNRLPIFRMGSVVCARRSSLRDWIAEQERQSVSPK